MVNNEPHGADYVPAITIRQFGSSGKRCRIAGIKTERVHHLLSELEAHFFYALEWLLSVVDIREQYPIRPTAAVVRLARARGVRPPSGISDDRPWTTDFLLTLREKGETSYVAVSVKPFGKLRTESRTRELLHLERACWAQYGIRCLTLTNRALQGAMMANLLWCSPMRHPESFMRGDPAVRHRFIRALRDSILANPELPLAVVCRTHDFQWEVDTGTSLSGVRYAIAQRSWSVSLDKRIDPLKPSAHLGHI